MQVAEISKTVEITNKGCLFCKYWSEYSDQFIKEKLGLPDYGIWGKCFNRTNNILATGMGEEVRKPSSIIVKLPVIGYTISTLSTFMCSNYESK